MNVSRSLAAGFGWQRSTRLSRALVSAQECSRKAELLLENAGGASSLLFLSGVGAGLVTSYITGLLADGGIAAPAELTSGLKLA